MGVIPCRDSGATTLLPFGQWLHSCSHWQKLVTSPLTLGVGEVDAKVYSPRRVDNGGLKPVAR